MIQNKISKLISNFQEKIIAPDKVRIHDNKILVYRKIIVTAKDKSVEIGILIDAETGEIINDYYTSTDSSTITSEIDEADISPASRQLAEKLSDAISDQYNQIRLVAAEDIQRKIEKSQKTLQLRVNKIYAAIQKFDCEINKINLRLKRKDSTYVWISDYIDEKTYFVGRKDLRENDNTLIGYRISLQTGDLVVGTLDEELETSKFTESITGMQIAISVLNFCERLAKANVALA